MRIPVGLSLLASLMPGVLGQAPASSPSSGSPSAAETKQQVPEPQTDLTSALEFLGSLSAPSAIAASETGHTSAHLPSVAADRRLLEIEGALDALPTWPADGPQTTGKGQLAAELWAQVRLAQLSGHPGQARTWLSHLLVLFPDSAALWFQLGGVALEEARADSRRLAEIAPESSWNRLLEAEALAERYPELARSRSKENRSQKSEVGSQNEEASEDSPVDDLGVPAASTSTAMGNGLRTADHGQPLAKDQGQRTRNDSPKVLYQRAHQALDLSKEAYRRASESPHFDARLHALRALAAEEEHDDEAAIREYQTGLARHPESAILHAGLGHFYRFRSDLRAARRELEQAWRFDSSDPLVGFELGDVYERLGRSQEALKLLNQALEFDPALTLARWSRAKAYLALGDNEHALQDLLAAAPTDDTGEVQWQLARLYQKLGQSDLARQAEQRSEEQKAVNRKQ